MKNVMKKILVVALAALMLFSMVSCDKSGSVKKAFEKKEYKVSTVKADNEAIKPILDTLLTADQVKELSKYELILCQNGLNLALIVKFSNGSQVKDFLTVETEDGKKDTSAYDKAKEAGTINGNCVLFTISKDAKDVFKNA